ncbi:unnamed protein product [Ixodes hexagonus]
MVSLGRRSGGYTPDANLSEQTMLLDVNPYVRYPLVSFNILFWLLGLGFIFTGVYAYFDTWTSPTPRGRVNLDYNIYRYGTWTRLRLVCLPRPYLTAVAARNDFSVEDICLNFQSKLNMVQNYHNSSFTSMPDMLGIGLIRVSFFTLEANTKPAQICSSLYHLSNCKNLFLSWSVPSGTATTYEYDVLSVSLLPSELIITSSQRDASEHRDDGDGGGRGLGVGVFLRLRGRPAREHLPADRLLAHRDRPAAHGPHPGPAHLLPARASEANAALDAQQQPRASL